MKTASMLLTWALLVLYTFLQISWDLLHNSFHEEKSVSHSLVVEKNSCHRSVYHGAKDSHKNHLTSFKSFTSCHISSVPSEVGTDSFYLCDGIDAVWHDWNFCDAPESVSILNGPVRGPPHQLI